ncbi:hypothetical protein [Longitalea luteola]|uniref:hypothetical protein n=1 Tax=Longitalea luteola TaxID=2812563 RepID=UPI001A96F4B6|nr:hypothetical protein [Longitalea luteola]
MKNSRLYIVLLSLVSTKGMGQSFNGTINPVISIQSVMAVSITNNASSTINFTNAQYASGYTISNFNTFNIKSNQPWRLSVSAATPNFSASGSYASNNMPASVIGVVKSGQSPFKQLSSTDQVLATGNRGNAGISGNSFNMDLMANPGYAYGPGIYTLTIVYTLSAQ